MIGFYPPLHEYREGEAVIPGVTQILKDAGIVSGFFRSGEARERGSALRTRGAGIVMRGLETNVFTLETFMRGLETNVFMLETFMRDLETNVFTLETFVRGLETNVFTLETFVCVSETNVFAPETGVVTMGGRGSKRAGIGLPRYRDAV
jgi:hypothetical protein